MRLLSLIAYFICFTFFVSCSKTKNKQVIAPGETFTNLQYGVAPDTSGKQESLTMDIDLPAQAAGTTKYPVMLLIHGGGFAEGDKKEMASHCSLLADSGYVGVSINYRLGWKRGATKCEGDTLSEYDALYRAVQDANAALRFLVAHAEMYHIDTSRIFIGGGSAGSTIAMYTTYFTPDLALQKLPAQYQKLGALNSSGNTLANTFTIKGILNMWGGIGDSALINKATAVPMVSFHGTADPLSPYDMGHEYSCDAFPRTYGSACISRQLDAYKIPYLLHLKKGAAHSPAEYKPPFVIPIAVRFFNALEQGKPMASAVVTE